jgi:type II secretion system protein J
MRRASPVHRSARGPVQRGLGEAGFTLLELLIATAVGAIVLLAIQTAMFGALRMQNTAHAKIETGLELQHALSIARRDFSGLMLPPTGTGTVVTLAGHLQSDNFSSTGNANLGERVTPDLFTNSGRIDGWSQFADAQMVTYYLARAQDGSENKDLVRVVQRNLLPVQESAGEPQIILHGVQEAAMEFFDGTSWTNSWDSEATSTLPTALKFRLVMAAPDRSQPAPAATELVVPIFVLTTQSATEAAEAANP